MRNVSVRLHHICQLATILLSLITDVVCYLGLCLRPSPALAAENLFLRKQLALYQEREAKPQRATNTIRLALVWLSPWFDWRSALSSVKPETFTRWHRQCFRWFWHCKSKAGRPALPKDLQALIRRMAIENPTWGHDRFQAEFNRRLIRDQKLFSASMRFVHNDLIGRRHTADYSPQHVGSRAAERCLRKATDMVLSIAEVLEQ